MATSKLVYSGKQWRVGILAQSALGTIKAADQNFVQLPLMEVTMPTITTQDGGGIRSGNSGMIGHDKGMYRTEKGGEVVWSFEMPCELEWAAQIIGSTFQDLAQSGSGPYVHTIEASSSNALARPAFGAPSTGIPAYYTLAFDGPVAGGDILMQDAIVRNLTITCDPNSNEGRCYLSGEFYSGHTLTLEQTMSGTWTSRTQTYMYPDWTTKTMDVDGNANQDIFISSVDFSVNNNASRLGFDSNGDAETYKWGVPEVEITGNISVKYDAEVGLESGTNVLQDFLSGSSATLTLQSGDGTVSTAGEHNITAEIYYTGQPDIDLAGDDGVFVTLPFKVVQPTNDAGGFTANGVAFKYEVADGTATTGW
tara:strand:- start:34846 stop:35943 length:1098 start_codon:yes stop_codon:yes gene_type:complete